MMEGVQERRGSSTCLVCGRKGGNTVLVTSVHSFVSASGTPLADFLVKVVGEDPCYSVSEVICQQCFVLLDRLDAYQARAAEIHTHVTSRYRDTKLELLGQRQRMSELIASSLSNVKDLRHGTTLNVSDELTITIVHEAMPKRNVNYRLHNGDPFGNKALNGRSNPLLSQYISPKFKRKRLPESSFGLEIPFAGKKKRKLTLCANGALKNNNNISYNKSVRGLLSEPEDTGKSKVDRDSSGEEERDESEEEKEEEEEEEQEQGESEDDSSSSDSDSSSAEDDEDNVKKEVVSPTKSHEEYDDEDSRRHSGEDTPLKRPPSSLSPDHESDTNTSRQEALEILAQRQLQEQQLQAQLQLQAAAENQTVPPHVAEAMLMQSPLATSLLQSFLSTSLWFGSPDTSKKKQEAQTKKKQREMQDPDDVTRETLAVAAGSTKDKKKRQELKNTGQSYVNTKGKLVEAKRVWPQDCSRCPLKCNARITEDDRLHIFAEYWGLADYNLQRNYLAAHMQREEKRGPSGLLRTVVLYFLSKDKDTKLQVCRQFFLKTLDVSEKASRIVLEKMVRGELGGDNGTATPSSRPQSSAGDEKQDGEEEEEEDAKSYDSS